MIVFFLPDLRAGGAERVMLNLLLSYHDKFPKQELVLLLFKEQGPLLKDVPESIKIYELGTSGATKSFFSFLFFCRKHQPKIVFSSLGASLTTSLARVFVSKKSFFINRIGNTIGAEKLLFSNPIKRFLYVFANQIIAKMSDHVIFQCHYMAKDYINETKIEPKFFSVIYNPVKINHIKILAQEKINEKYTFVAVGRLNPQKDYDNLIKACAILKEKNPDFTLAILGQGNLQAKLEARIEELHLQQQVFLLGHKKNPYPYIQNSKYLVSSSLYEGFSNVIIESLCLGKPVIATDCPGGNAEVLTHGLNGWLCEYKNPLALAEVMDLALENSLAYSSEIISNNNALLYSHNLIFNQYENILKRYL
jgi:glycosyltransferase involved in cell wall biosynthesis